MITVYVLSLYSCMTLNNFDGSLASKTCSWSSLTAIYASEKTCKDRGQARIGESVYADNIPIGPDGRSVYGQIENFRCGPLSVEE